MSLVRPCLSLILVLLADVQPCFASDPTSEEAAASHRRGRQRTKQHLLGRGHLWLQVERVDFTGVTQDVWGVDTDRYFGLAGWWGGASNVYLGLELGRVGVGTTRTGDGELIEDFSFDNGEFNFKKLFDLTSGFSFGVGGGGALFLARGEAVDAFDRSDLADFGYGYQGFVEFDFRVRHFLIGVEVKYQAAIDFLGIDNSSLRFGPHVGVVF